MKIPSISALESFRYAAEFENIGQAAKKLGVTHSSISQHITGLEDRLGVRLFTRRNRRVFLTDEGRIFFDQISLSLNEIERACERLRSLKSRHRVRIGCIPSIATRWLIPNIEIFRESLRNTKQRFDFELVYAHPDQVMDETELDILITYGTQDLDNLHSYPLLPRTNFPVASQIYIERHGLPKSASEILSSPLLHDESEKDWQRWAQHAGAKASDIKIGPVYQDFNLLSTALISGQGIGLCPIAVFSKEIDQGELVVLSEIGLHNHSSYLIIHKAHAAEVVKRFCNWFVKFCHEQTSPKVKAANSEPVPIAESFAD